MTIGCRGLVWASPLITSQPVQLYNLRRGGFADGFCEVPRGYDCSGGKA